MAVIRQLKNWFTKQVIYPKTVTSAVYDPNNGERLDKILRDTFILTDNEEYNGVEPRDADTLGSKYKASDITNIENDVDRLKIDVSNTKDNLKGFEPIIDESTGEITGYKTSIGGADTVFPFKSDVSVLCTVTNSAYNNSSMQVDLSSYLDDITKYSADNFIIVPKSVGYYGISISGEGSSSYNPKRGENDVSIQYDNATGKLTVNGLCSGTTFNNGYFEYYGYISSFDVIFIP